MLNNKSRRLIDRYRGFLFSKSSSQNLKSELFKLSNHSNDCITFETGAGRSMITLQSLGNSSSRSPSTSFSSLKTGELAIESFFTACDLLCLSSGFHHFRKWWIRHLWANDEFHRRDSERNWLLQGSTCIQWTSSISCTTIATTTFREKMNYGLFLCFFSNLFHRCKQTKLFFSNFSLLSLQWQAKRTIDFEPSNEKNNSCRCWLRFASLKLF